MSVSIGESKFGIVGQLAQKSALRKVSFKYHLFLC